MNESTDILSEYWNRRVTDWKITNREPGTEAYFREIESYRFDKLDYLPRRVDYAGYAGRRVLDVGCGLGTDTSRFAAGGAIVTGIDVAERAIEMAERNFAQRGLTGSFEVMNGEAMSYADQSFDVIYCHTVLQFTANPEQLVSECIRVLKPGGTLILMGINKYSWLYAMHLLLRIKIDYLDSPYYHLHSKKHLHELVSTLSDVVIHQERYPVATKVHGGAKAALFNAFFVPLYRLVPLSFKRSCCHHLLVVARKGNGLDAT
jgi:2-polyprenyl-3-methyl-5-hydroxy-6-metoxy-1,4-benzoquinol methylase